MNINSLIYHRSRLIIKANIIKLKVGPFKMKGKICIKKFPIEKH
jgi:hypothetical protein